MQYPTQKESFLQRGFDFIRKNYPFIIDICRKITAFGGEVLVVGGAVRDLLSNLPVKDIDCEVYGISLEVLQKILEQFGPVSLVGTTFGVLRLHGLNVDWSLPRVDSNGRKPHVVLDTSMSYYDAFRRRDVTINAMGLNLVTGALIDPYNGYTDLVHKILRATDTKTFVEDPLRFYRIMQFVGRFEMSVDASLAAVCRTMDISDVSRERIAQEFEKLVLRSKFPSHGFRWLQEVGRLQEVLPELYGTINIPQRSDFHPEGDVFEHTMQAVDAAAAIARAYDTDTKRLMLIYGALCHDLGKQDVTVMKDGIWRSTGHALAGVPRAKKMLARMTGKKNIISIVALLVEYHMEPGMYVKEQAKSPAYKRLAHILAPNINLRFLADVAYADKRGRNPHGHEPLTDNDEQITTFVERAQQAGVFDACEQPVLQGRDFLDLGVTGVQIGELVKRAYELQIRHDIHDKQELKQFVLSTTETVQRG
jgi:tRNA nucleotidyltransferase (CCA-adding enzyme)